MVKSWWKTVSPNTHTRTVKIVSTAHTFSFLLHTFNLKRSWRNWMSGLMYMCLLLKAGSRGIYSRDPKWKSGDRGGPARYSCEKDPSGSRPNTSETGTTNPQLRGSSNRPVNSANSWGSSGRQNEARQRHHRTYDIIGPVHRALDSCGGCTAHTPNMDKSCPTIQQHSTSN